MWTTLTFMTGNLAAVVLGSRSALDQELTRQSARIADRERRVRVQMERLDRLLPS